MEGGLEVQRVREPSTNPSSGPRALEWLSEPNAKAGVYTGVLMEFKNEKPPMLDYASLPKLPRYRWPVLTCAAVSIVVITFRPIWQVMYRGAWESTFESESLWSALEHLHSGAAHWKHDLLWRYSANFAIAAFIGGLVGAAGTYIARHPPQEG